VITRELAAFSAHAWRPDGAPGTYWRPDGALGTYWRPGGAPGTYVCWAAGGAEGLVAEFAKQSWVQSATSRNDYVTVTVTREALANVALEVSQAGNRCVTSDALRGHIVPAALPADLAAAPDWETARAALAAELTATVAAAAGATVVDATVAGIADAAATGAGATVAQAPTRPGAVDTAGRRVPNEGPGTGRTVRYDIEWAGEAAVRFALARMRPGEPPAARVERRTPDNPAYAVRYAHAVAAAVLRWTGTEPGEFRPRQLAEPGELALLDALSWLPERVATAARRGRPDEFARYLETLASRTIDNMSITGPNAEQLSSEQLWLAEAARTGLAAGLALLGIAAPDRL
jgi:DALR anticodon binding domain